MILKLIRRFQVHFKLIILVVEFTFLSSFCHSQDVKTIDLKAIRQKTVRRYITERKIDQMNDFSLIHASWKNETDELDFNFREKVFFLKYKVANVWNFYRHANPAEVWNKQSIRLGLLISKPSNSAFYVNNIAFPDMDTGQVYFLKLRLAKGLFNIPVAFEIIKIDYDKQLFEFSYIENNKSKGKQTIQFFDNNKGDTRIVHQSYFKSESSFRDLLYPHFHKKFIKEFHRNMKHYIRKTDLTVIKDE